MIVRLTARDRNDPVVMTRNVSARRQRIARVALPRSR